MPISPYVSRLRAVVGHDLLLLPSVSVVPHDGEGRLLLVKHSYTGSWGIIGGTVEPDERPEDAAVRETLEETGLDVVITLRAVVGGPDYRVVYPNGDVGAFVITVYDGEVVSGDMRPDGDETTDVRWFSPPELRTLGLNDLAKALLTDIGELDL